MNQQSGERRASPRPLVAGNWKMHGLAGDGATRAAALDRLARAAAPLAFDLLVCPPATLVAATADLLAGGPVVVGGQDCHSEAAGAFTGETSAPMLADAGATYAIVGHSERRHGRGETSALVCTKAAAAHAAGLTAIVCIGETEAERDDGRTLAVLSDQLAGSLPAGAIDGSNTVIAYEPVWAIGTGRTPTPEEVAVAHAHMRAGLAEIVGDAAAAIRLVYGGSVKPDNARELLGVANVDGALVGGASLDAEAFWAIAAALPVGG